MMRIVGVLLFGLIIINGWAMAEDIKPSLEEALGQVEVPPDWFQSVETNYDTNHPWEEARLEVRRLLSFGDERSREAINLTYLYLQKEDIGNGHEYPMYLLLGGEYAWALQTYEDFLKGYPKGNTHGYRSLASCYIHFGEYGKAIEILNIALSRLPDPPWEIANRADVHDGLGDIYAEMGNFEKAKEHYGKSMEIYPTSDQPYGRHLIYRRIKKIQTKLDLLKYQSLESAQLRDGTYTSESLGYAESIAFEVTIKNGKIADIQLKHQEKIEQNATTIIPQRIIAQQSLKVDGITGATITYQAIVDGVFSALKEASLK